MLGSSEAKYNIFCMYAKIEIEMDELEKYVNKCESSERVIFHIHVGL